MALAAGLAHPLSPNEEAAPDADACAEPRSLAARVSCRVDRMADDGPFRIPSPRALAAWRQTARQMLAGRCAEIELPEALDGYRVGPFTDETTGRELCLLAEGPDGTLGWGTFVTDPGETRPVHLLAPHPLHDAGTPAQAVDVFLGARARSVLVAGASRFAAPRGSGCGRRPASDPTHSPLTMFQPTVEALMEAAPEDLLLQLHGMAPTSCRGVDVYLTHGSTEPPAADDVLVTLREGLAASRPDWAVATPGADGPPCHLNGTRNVQGRLLSGVPRDQVCERPAPRPDPRFVHVEQKARAREAAPWIPILQRAFPLEAPVRAR